MPPPSSENDLKRLARRRLIGAVALTLLAVIVLPLLLEDEPPPASSLAVRMATAPESSPDRARQPEQNDEPGMTVPPSPPVALQPEQTVPQAELVKALPSPEPVKPEPIKPEPVKPEPVKPEPVKPEPVKPEPAKAAPATPIPKSQTSKPAATPATQVNPAAASEVFVVQLAALSDSAKAQVLKERAAKAGLPAYTDQAGELTRVRVGPYMSRAAAVAAAVKLAENGMKGQVLIK